MREREEAGAAGDDRHGSLRGQRAAPLCCVLPLGKRLPRGLGRREKGSVAAATALLGVAAVAKDRDLLVFAIGLLLIGLGEWINHPFQTRVFPGGIASGEVRRPKVPGLALVAVGTVLFCLALFRLAAPLLRE